MNPRKPLFIAFAIVVAAQVASGAEAMGSDDSLSDLSAFVTLQGFRIGADHCSAKFPQLKPRFDGLMEDLNLRIQGISKVLLSSAAFKGVKDKRVPAEIDIAFKDSLDDARRNFERQDAGTVCPKALQRLVEMDDESLKAGLTQVLVAVQNMTRHLEKGGASHASPESRAR